MDLKGKTKLEKRIKVIEMVTLRRHKTLLLQGRAHYYSWPSTSGYI